MKLDVLAFAAHPDDAELGCGGTLALKKKQGKKTGIIELTLGELSTRGTVEGRKKEAANAARILQLDARENLELRDGFFENNEASQLKVISAIRKYQPEILLCNAPEDRHPDHGRAERLVQEAAFLAGLRKIETSHDGELQAPWRPKYVLNYIQDRLLEPDFLIDISEVMEQKIEAMYAFTSQLNSTGTEEPQTYISSPSFFEGVINRAKMWGRMIGVEYAEGFISKKKLGLRSFDALILENT